MFKTKETFVIGYLMFSWSEKKTLKGTLLNRTFYIITK